MNQVFPEITADERQVGGSHYKDMPMQPWDVMQAVLTPEEFRGFLKASIIKYSLREACTAHIKAWYSRASSCAVVMRTPSGKRYSYNDSLEVANG